MSDYYNLIKEAFKIDAERSSAITDMIADDARRKAMQNGLIETISKEIIREHEQWLNRTIKSAIPEEDKRIYDICCKNLSRKDCRDKLFEIMNRNKVKILKIDVWMLLEGLYRWQYLVFKNNELHATRFFKH